MGRLPAGVEPTYTAQIVIMATPEQAAELRAWAEKSGRYASDFQREVLARGLEQMRPELEAQYGRLTRNRINAWAARLVSSRAASAQRQRVASGDTGA